MHQKKLEVVGGREVGAATPPPAKLMVVAGFFFVIGLGIHSFTYDIMKNLVPFAIHERSELKFLFYQI